LLVRSLWRVLAVDPGFDPRGVLTFDVSLPYTRYDRLAAARFFTDAIDKLAAVPSVESAAATTVLPLHGDNNVRYFSLEGRRGDSPRDYTIANHRLVTARYFSALAMPIIKGRAFDAADCGPAAAPVVVVNQAFARVFLGLDDPVGKRLKMGERTDAPTPWMTIVGVVGDVHNASLEVSAASEFYRPFAQTANGEGERTMTFVLKTLQTPESLTEAARRIIRAVDPDQPIANVAPMERLVAESLSRRRFSLALLGAFAATALALTIVGVYGVMSYVVQQSTRTIGIRLALGAQPRDIVALALGPGLLWTSAGLAGGLGASLLLVQVMRGMLFGVPSTDPVSFFGVSAVIGVVAFMACFVPAHRATRIDPVEALRSE
jgi:putative ABC transport system permease protein